MCRRRLLPKTTTARDNCGSICLQSADNEMSGISARNGYPGTRVLVSIPVTRVPVRYPCTRVSLNTRAIFFTKLGTLYFLSDNLNTTARAVDSLHLHHKAGLQGWVPFIAPALLRVPAMSKRAVGFQLKSRCGDARRRACRTPNAAINQIRSRH